MGSKSGIDPPPNSSSLSDPCQSCPSPNMLMCPLTGPGSCVIQKIAPVPRGLVCAPPTVLISHQELLLLHPRSRLYLVPTSRLQVL